MNVSIDKDKEVIRYASFIVIGAIAALVLIAVAFKGNLQY